MIQTRHIYAAIHIDEYDTNTSYICCNAHVNTHFKRSKHMVQCTYIMMIQTQHTHDEMHASKYDGNTSDILGNAHL